LVKIKTNTKTIDMKAEEFITQEGRDNIRWIDAEELAEILDKYANQRVIEELYIILDEYQLPNEVWQYIGKKIEKLKQ